MIPLDRIPPPNPPAPSGSPAPRPGETPDRTIVIDTRTTSRA